jgi:hypothetical protein
MPKRSDKKDNIKNNPFTRFPLLDFFRYLENIIDNKAKVGYKTSSTRV